jgi:hypothetical protein
MSSSAQDASFHASNGFVYDFTRRNGFGSRRAHMKRRPMIEADVEERWVRAIRELIETKNPGRILNIDETSWRLCPTGIPTWAETGAEDVPVNVSGDLKECVTVLATISADMRKLPLVIIPARKFSMTRS